MLRECRRTNECLRVRFTKCSPHAIRWLLREQRLFPTALPLLAPPALQLQRPRGPQITIKDDRQSSAIWRCAGELGPPAIMPGLDLYPRRKVFGRLSIAAGNLVQLGG